MSFYASAFRHRRHYVFGLSICPSQAWNTLFWPVHGSVGPPDQPWPFYGMSIRPSGEVSGHFLESAWREWPEIFTRGQFWPSGIVVACVSVCVCLSVCHLLVRAITRDLFKLGLPTLDQRCKRPCLWPLLFWGGNWPWPSRSNLT